MKTLFVAWQTPDTSRAWFPVGRLDASDELYRFSYTNGAEEAERSAGFKPMPAFPDFHKVYESNTLFPLFQNRVMQSSRPDFAEYLQWLDLDPNHFDPMEVLALTGGERQTDRLEIFPKLDTDPSQYFHSRFFLHGLRHTNLDAFKRLDSIQTGDSLNVSVEVTNPATGLAVQLMTSDYYMLGWAPRYLVDDLVQMVESHQNIQAKVVRNNLGNTPMSCRVLVEISGVMPAGKSPMSSLRFQPIAQRLAKQ